MPGYKVNIGVPDKAGLDIINTEDNLTVHQDNGMHKTEYN